MGAIPSEELSLHRWTSGLARGAFTAARLRIAFCHRMTRPCTAKALVPLLFLMFGCAASPPPVMVKADPIRKEPVTGPEVEAKIKGVSDKIMNCYRAERMNVGINAPAGADALARFVFRVRVPTDGSKVGVTVAKSSRPEQHMLAECVSGVLKRLSFPAHAGQPLDVEMPIEP